MCFVLVLMLRVFGEDRRLGPKTDVDRVIGQLWLRKSELRVVHASKLFVKS